MYRGQDPYQGNAFQSGLPAGGTMSQDHNSMLDTIGFLGMGTEFLYDHMASSWLDKNLMQPSYKAGAGPSHTASKLDRGRAASNLGMDKKLNVRAGKSAAKVDDLVKAVPYSASDMTKIRRLKNQSMSSYAQSGKYKGFGYSLREQMFGKSSPARKKSLLGWFDTADEARMKAIVRRSNEDVMKKLSGMKGTYQGTAKAFVAARSFARLANYGMFADIAMTVGKAAFSGVAALGATLKHTGGAPESFSEGFSDSQMAYTMRQRSMQAIQRAQLGARRSLGNEASILHSAR